MGLPEDANRRVRGLRRSEVATLAGVSVEYYTRLEQGALSGASREILDGISRALLLDDAERAHLFDLAHAASPVARPPRRRNSKTWAPHASLQWALDAVTAGPAFVRNGRMDLLAVNALGRAFYKDVFEMPGQPPNLARFIFLDERGRDFHPDWDAAADVVVSILRTEAGRDPHNKELHDLIGELSTRNQEFRRRWSTHNVRLSEKTLRELYLLPFSMAAQDAGVWSMMAAYNDINGTTATENAHVQDEIVKQEWGWDGLIMSDWFATKRTVEAANGGLDLVMPRPEGPWGERLVAAVRRGDVAEDTIDEHLARLLLLAERAGALGEPATARGGFPAPDSPERREQLRRIAGRGMVLLKNDDGALPLTKEARPALIGRHAVQTQGMGGGSAQVNPPHLTSVAEAFATHLGETAVVIDGVDVRTRPVPAAPSFVIDPVTGEPGMRVTHFSISGTELATRHEPGTTITVGWDDDFAEKPAAVEFTVRLRNQSGPVRLGGIGAGNWTLPTAAGDSSRRELPITGYDPADAMLRPPSFVETLELPADAIVTLRLEIAGVDWAEKFAAQPRLGIAEESHLLATGSFGSVSLVAEQRTRTDEDALAAAETAARAVGTAVVVVGLTEEDETEAVDKTSLCLPGRQDELVRRVAAAAERTVVVINAATPVLMPWLDEVDAVLIAGLPGLEAGDAIADVLFGDAEPTGRLVTSFPREDGASPAWTVTPDAELAVRYEEGTAIGYRGFHAGLASEPLFWFGAGLGYGTWEYTDARLLGKDWRAVAVTVRNTGKRTSRETVQLYFQPALAGEPVRLVGYTGVQVTPGATATVEVEGDSRLFRRWDEESGRWKPLGSGQLLIARGLGDIRARLAVD